MTSSEYKEKARYAVQAFGLSVITACGLFGLSRATYYKRSQSTQLERDVPVIEAFNKSIGKYPRWGFWKCFGKVRNEGHRFNYKRCHRVYGQMKLNMPRRTTKRVITREKQPLTVYKEHNTTVYGLWISSMMHCMTAEGFVCSTSSTNPIDKLWRLSQAFLFQQHGSYV